MWRLQPCTFLRAAAPHSLRRDPQSRAVTTEDTTMAQTTTERSTAARELSAEELAKAAGGYILIELLPPPKIRHGS